MNPNEHFWPQGQGQGQPIQYGQELSGQLGGLSLDNSYVQHSQSQFQGYLPQHSGGYAMPYAPMPLDSGHAHPGYGMQPHHGAPPAQFAYGQQFPMHVAMGYPPQQQQQYGAGPGGRGSGQRPGQNVNRQPGPTGGPQWRGPGMPPGQGHGQMQGPGQGQGRGAMQPNRGPQQAQQPRPRNTGGIGSEGAPRTSTESGGPLGGVLGGFIVDMEGAPSEAPSGSGTDPNKLKKTSTLRKGLEMNVKRTIYICDIYQDASEEELATIFNDCGEVVDCRLCGDPSSSLRFAFIEFAEPASVDIAMKKSGTLLGDIPIRCMPSKTAIVPVNSQYLPQNEGEREQVDRTVYIASIDKRVEKIDVKNFFESVCGPVAKLRLLGDSHHAHRIAFIEFKHADSAVTALSCSGALLGSIPIRVYPSKTPVRSGREKKKREHELGGLGLTAPGTAETSPSLSRSPSAAALATDESGRPDGPESESETADPEDAEEGEAEEAEAEAAVEAEESPVTPEAGPTA